MNAVVSYIGLGANLSQPQERIQSAISELKFHPNCQLVAVSSLYRSQPWGPVQDQPDYLNAVMALTTDLPAKVLLQQLQTIECRLGRVRSSHERYGARMIDCDLLLYGNLVLNEDILTLPHRYLTERDFVLYPLLEIAPELILPTGQRLASYTKQCANCNLVKLPWV